LVQVLSPPAARFPLQVRSLLEKALALRERYEQGLISLHGLWTAAGRLEARLDRLLARPYRTEANRRLAQHLRHEQPHLFTFLRCPGLEATNNAAERALRGVVIAREVWGGNRTWNGARTQGILTSVLRTCRQQGQDAFALLVGLLRSPRRVRLSAASAEQPELTGTAGQYEPLRLMVVAGASADSRLWMELIERSHHLGCGVPVGAQLRYLVRSGRTAHQALACLQWTSAAWKMAARDRWIGWTHEQRARALPYIVNNSRFLILSWVRIKGLASKILAHCARQLPEDWQRRYGYWPLLLETVVDGQRFAGTCYRAANWIPLGQTQGRGRMDRYHQADGSPRKLLLVYPLCRHVQQRLREAQPPCFSSEAEAAWA
jgi:hypothetical protein